MNKIEVIGAKETIYTEHLNNGLDIYMVPNNKVKNYYITLNVKYGSIYTNYKINGKTYKDPKGIAHYLEHTTFNMPNEDVFDHFSKYGASANAYTSDRVTAYEVFANSNFKENLEYLLKYVYTPYYTNELINKERGIITEEIKMYADDPSSELFHGLYENIFINDERRYLIAGTTEDIKEITTENILNAYNSFYHPENMFVILTGNFKPEEAVAIISEQMSNFTFQEYSYPELKEASEPFKVVTEYYEKEMNVNKSKVAIAYKIPKNNFRSLKISDLVLKMYIDLIMKINFGITSIINEEMRSNGIISKPIGIRLTETSDYYVESFVAETDYPDYFTNRVQTVFSNMSAKEEDIQRKIKSSISNLVWLFDDIEAINESIQDDILDYGTVISDAYTIYKSLNRETASKIISKMDKNLMSINIIKPQNEKSA